MTELSFLGGLSHEYRSPCKSFFLQSDLMRKLFYVVIIFGKFVCIVGFDSFNFILKIFLN